MQRQRGNRATAALVEQLRDGDDNQSSGHEDQAHAGDEAAEAAGQASSDGQEQAGDEDVLTRKSRALRRKKEVTDSPDGYNRAIKDYVMRAGRAYVVVQQQTELLGADYRSLKADVEEYHATKDKAATSEEGSKEHSTLVAKCNGILKTYAKDLAAGDKELAVDPKVDKVIVPRVKPDERSTWKKVSDGVGRAGKKTIEGVKASPGAAWDGTTAAASGMGRGAKALGRGVANAGKKLVGKGPKPIWDNGGAAKLDAALDRARQRWQRSSEAMEQIVVDRALIEHNADKAQNLRNAVTLEALESKVQRRMGRNGSPAVDDGQRLAALRDLAVDSAHRLEAISVKRNVVKADFTFVQKDLDRFPGARKKIAWAVAAGATSAVVGMATMGFARMQSRTDDQGRVKNKWWPFEGTLLNGWSKRMRQFRSEAAIRAGKFVWDRISARLGQFNELVLQNVVNTFGTFGTWLTVIGAVLAVAGLAGYGVGAIPGVLLTHLGLIVGAVALAASLLKVAINAVRASAAFATALWNQDAKVQNQLNARAVGTTTQTVGDVTQAVAKGVSVAGMGLNIGGVTSGLSTMGQHGYEAGKIGTETGLLAVKIGAVDLLPAGLDAVDDRQSAYDNTGPGLNRLHPAAQAKTTLEQLRVREALKSRLEKLQGEAQPVNTRIEELSLHLKAMFAPLVRLKDGFAKLAAKVGSVFKKTKATDPPVDAGSPADAAKARSAVEGAGLFTDFLHQVLETTETTGETVKQGMATSG